MNMLSPGNLLTKEDCTILIQQARELAGTTGIEIFLLLTRCGHVHSYATESLLPLLTESQGRLLIMKLLSEHYRPTQKEEEPPQDPLEEEKEDNLETFTLIEDIQKRYEAFSTGYNKLRETLIAKTRPQNPFGEEGVLIVATPSQKVLTYASPGLEPLVKTSEGKKLISVLLSSTTHQSENQK